MASGPYPNPNQHEYEKNALPFEENLGEDYHTPEIYECTDKWIIMQYKQGDTLMEFFERVIWNSNKISVKELEIIKSIITDLASYLRKFAIENIFHLDLSPNNIIIEENSKTGKKYKV